MSTKLIDVLDAIDHRGREVVEGEMGLWVRVSEWGLVREALRHSPSESVGEVRLPRTIYEGALNYIRHVGSNWTMRGEPHPQQWIVDGLEAAAKGKA